ncbi:hypothetical protein Taro_031657 [Colocasia esculenta]|uniref:Uncharacterized protein n=1 Tax=Colocasia esculenta TaxID=4460 RepID=A0A843VJC7_COLES|nr:hypothetical protein [Colocasia esculenta]
MCVQSALLQIGTSRKAFYHQNLELAATSCAINPSWRQALCRQVLQGVDTGSSSVDTGSSSVDTRSSSVDTRDPSQKSFVPVWDSVSTHPMGRSTHSGNFSTISHIWTRGTLGIL